MNGTSDAIVPKHRAGIAFARMRVRCCRERAGTRQRGTSESMPEKRSPERELQLSETLTFAGVGSCIAWFGLVFWWVASL